MPDPPIPARYAILLELLRGGPLRASDLTEATELTVQGVSYHLKQLESQGHIAFQGEDRRAQLTPAGLQALHEHFRGLKAFVDLALSEMFDVEACVALAAEDLSEGQEVGLFMEDGQLVARGQGSPSQGRVSVGGAAGDPVVVAGLSGLVDLAPGTVHLVELPPPASLPGPEAVTELVEQEALTWDLLALSGLEAEVLAKRAGLTQDGEVTRFAAARAARSAAQVGLDVLLVASEETLEGVDAVLRDPQGATDRAPTIARYTLPGTQGTS